MQSYYANRNLPEPAIPALKSLELAQRSDRAGDRCQFRHRSCYRCCARQGWCEHNNQLRGEPG